MTLIIEQFVGSASTPTAREILNVVGHGNFTAKEKEREKKKERERERKRERKKTLFYVYVCCDDDKMNIDLFFESFWNYI